MRGISPASIVAPVSARKSEVRALHATSISPPMFRTQAQQLAVRLDSAGGKTRGSGARCLTCSPEVQAQSLGRLR
jgi:hypothetical protein